MQGFISNYVVRNTYSHGTAYKASKSTFKNYKQPVYIINSVHLPHNITRTHKLKKNLYILSHPHQYPRSQRNITYYVLPKIHCIQQYTIYMLSLFYPMHLTISDTYYIYDTVIKYNSVNVIP